MKRWGNFKHLGKRKNTTVKRSFTMGKSTIEWTEHTWNPVTGCSKLSAGCLNCYALRMFERGLWGYGPEVTIRPERLAQPLHWRKPRKVFVNSMSDLFHEEVRVEFIHQIFDVMKRASRHTFQALTKRSKRLAELSSEITWPDNVWMGVTVESKDYLHRLDHLRLVPAKIRFLSIEPLIGPLGEIDLTGIDWCIVGGESGPGARPMREEWVRDIRDQCVAAGVPFLFKQWGGIQAKKNGRLLDGRTWDEYPA
jgi:protein gp37